MSHERRIPVAANAVIAAAQFVAALFLLAYAATASGWRLGAAAIAFAVVMNSVYAVIHESEHGILFPNARANELTGVVMALLFPAPYHLIRQGHIGHHMRNRSDDEAFDLYFDGEPPVWKWLQFLGIVTGFYWLTVVLANVAVLFASRLFDRSRFQFDRPSAAFMEALNPAYWRWIRIEALLVFATHAAILWWLDFAFAPYAILYCTFGFTWSAMQYVHHFGTERDVRNGARNLWLWTPLDYLWLNHNWHLTHHRHPTVPWPYLPRLAREEGNPPRGFLPFAYLRMWRGPRYSNVHVQNQFAGRVIR